MPHTLASLPRTTEQVAEWLGDETVEHLTGARVWLGGATFAYAVEQAALVEPDHRGPRFFEVLNADKRTRRDAGSWPESNYRDWHDTDGSVRAEPGARAESGAITDAVVSPGNRPPSTVTPSDARAEAAEAILGYRFHDRALLNRALTHASVGADNNGPLACLGDRIYNLWAARRVYALAPGASEGALTDAIVALCREETQAAVFYGLELHRLLQVGGSVSGNGGWITPPMVSTALEALVAAIDLDGGEASAIAFLDRVVTLPGQSRE